MPISNLTTSYAVTNANAITLDIAFAKPPITAVSALRKDFGLVSISKIEKTSHMYSFYSSSEVALKQNPMSFSQPLIKLSRETRESFPAYYRTLGGSRQTRIFPPLKDI